MPTIAITTLHPELKDAAQILAGQLQLPVTQTFADYDYVLILTPEFLGLQKTADKSLPLYVDFTSGKMNYRRQAASLRRETIARALGLKNNTQPKIFDATAGLARDSFIVASLGFEIQLLERSPIIYALVNDGIQRALKTANADIVKRMHLIQTDAITWLENKENQADIVYLDPMFPLRAKSALTKKDMRIFHDIVGDDIDSDKLLEAALACATRRVVVKRPRLAAELAGLKPNFSFSGSSNRFDVYIINH